LVPKNHVPIERCRVVQQEVIHPSSQGYAAGQANKAPRPQSTRFSSFADAPRQTVTRTVQFMASDDSLHQVNADQWEKKS
jgi:hypothetical protein